MRQYTTPEQTAKLIELVFEKPKSMNGEYNGWQFMPTPAYSIGELIELLPKHIEIKSQWCRLDIYPTKNKWYVHYENVVFNNLAKTSEIELIDALYDMIIRLKEEGVI